MSPVAQLSAHCAVKVIIPPPRPPNPPKPPPGAAPASDWPYAKQHVCPAEHCEEFEHESEEPLHEPAAAHVGPAAAPPKPPRPPKPGGPASVETIGAAKQHSSDCGQPVPAPHAMPPSAYSAVGIVEDPPEELPPLEPLPAPLLPLPAPLLEELLSPNVSPPVLGLVLLLQPAAQTHATRAKLITACDVFMKASYRRPRAGTP
jgi:hypothetical protein